MGDSATRGRVVSNKSEKSRLISLYSQYAEGGSEYHREEDIREEMNTKIKSRQSYKTCVDERENSDILIQEEQHRSGGK